MNKLPPFPYHPDPIATGSIVASDTVCRCCGQARGFAYSGPVYSEEELDDALCPWCIADGSAASKFGAEFVDPAGVGGYGDWERVSPSIIAEVSQRTPGFNGWQQERWWTHCGDAAEFLGAAGSEELQTKWQSAIPGIQKDLAYDDAEWAEYAASLDREYGPTAYVFRCRKCGSLSGYSDHN